MFAVGAIVEGKVTGLTKFGAFVSLPEGKSGLIHISEIASGYVTEVGEHLQNGQSVKVKIIGVARDGKINLSIKQALEQPARAPNPRGQARPMPPKPGGRPPAPSASFEDRLKQFMQETDQKNSSNRLYAAENKRGGTRRRK